MSIVYLWFLEVASHTNLSSPTSSIISCLLDTPGSSILASKYSGLSESIGCLNIVKSGSLDISVFEIDLFSFDKRLISVWEETSSIFEPFSPGL